MNVETIQSTGLTGPKSSASEEITRGRKNIEKASDFPQDTEKSTKVQPEELLKQIKSLTQDGLYSVRFEINESTDLVVKIFDNETQEVIRQIPAEELLSFKATFQELQGNIVNTKS